MQEKKPLLLRSYSSKNIALFVRTFCVKIELCQDAMTVFFDGQNECAEYVLRIILDRDDLHVIKSESQYSQTNLYGRSGRLDILAKDDAGKLYNIEIQRADKGAGAKRAREKPCITSTESCVRRASSSEVTKMSYVVEELVKQAEKFRDIDTAAILLADNKVTEEYIETMFRAAPRLVTGVPRV